MNKTGSNVKTFGITALGESVMSIMLDNGTLSCEILTYGATIRSLLVPDNVGGYCDVVLGYDSLKEYETQSGYLGATIGRFANRISKGRFQLNGNEFLLTKNDGEDHLHGGKRGFSHRVWSIGEVMPNKVSLELQSEAGEEGYPGNLNVRVTYELCDASLSIHYEAVSDTDTICNLTNHSYFNLAGNGSGSLMDHEILIHSTCFTPTDAQNNPTGDIEPVAGTPMDLRSFTSFASRLKEEYLQHRQPGGYDHNYVINGNTGQLRAAAQARSSRTGIRMQVDTTMPGVQFYTANYLDNLKGKNGSIYDQHHAFCLETQFFPDSPNVPSFSLPYLSADRGYDHRTVFTFSVESPDTR